MLNLIWTGFFLVAAVTAAYKTMVLGEPQVLSAMMEALFKNSATAFEISLGLTGVMTLWLGLMKIGEAAGAMSAVSRLLSPLLVRLFPGVPAGHPAFGAMLMNISANVLGLDNAATPLGLKAMRELQELNPEPDTATDAQIMFLVINTSSVTLIPVTIFTYLYQLGYPNPTELFIPILLATSFSTMTGVLATALYQRINLLRPWLLIFLLGLAGFMALLAMALLSLDQGRLQDISLLLGNGIIFGVIISFMLLAIHQQVKVYEEFISGAREGFQVAISIIPYLVAMLAGIGVFRASGALDLALSGLEAVVNIAAQGLAGLGLITYQGGHPAFLEALPTGLMKSLSGSGARGLMIETIKTLGPQALASKIAAVMQGSSETTFYVLAVYCGAVGIKKTRHAVTCGLIADAASICAAIVICYLFFG